MSRDDKVGNKRQGWHYRVYDHQTSEGRGRYALHLVNKTGKPYAEVGVRSNDKEYARLCGENLVELDKSLGIESLLLPGCVVYPQTRGLRRGSGNE